MLDSAGRCRRVLIDLPSDDFDDAYRVWSREYDLTTSPVRYARATRSFRGLRAASRPEIAPGRLDFAAI